MKQCTFFLLISICVFIGCAPSDKPEYDASPIAASLDSLLQVTVDEKLTPGVAVSVVSGKKVLYSKAFGTREIGADQALRTTDIFNFSSIVKTVISTAVMQHVESGKVELDHSAVQYIPILSGDLKEVTVRQMLSHSSGIQFSDNESATSGELNSKNLLLTHSPGTKLQYSNAAFYTLGKLVEEQSSVTISDYVSQHIFSPIGMSHSSIHTFEGLGSMTNPHTIEDSQLRSVVRPEVDSRKVGNGIFYTNIEDMALWAQLHLNEGTLKGETVLNSSSYDELWKPNLKTGWDKMKAAAGLGWFVGMVDGHRTVSHIGGTSGYSAALVLFPDEDRAIIIAGNSNRLPREDLIAKITGIILQ